MIYVVNALNGVKNINEINMYKYLFTIMLVVKNGRFK